MYPFSSEAGFARNHWYVAAWADEVGRSLRRRHILGDPIVFFRTEEGEARAFEDSCPHRRYPLSQGKLIGNQLRCQYHGFTYDDRGQCVHIPAQKMVPPNYKVRQYPLIEKWRWIWIWMGEPEQANHSLLPDQRWLKTEEVGWMATQGGLATVKARHGLLHENLLDLSHLSYLHEDTIGGRNIAETAIEMKEIDGRIDISRAIRKENIENLPLAKALGLTVAVDRIMAQQFLPPALHVTGSQFLSAPDDGSEPQSHASYRVLHGITPETAHSTHYFWGFSRDFLVEDQGITDGLKNAIAAAVVEDVAGSEAIEANLPDDADPRKDIHCKADAGALRGRGLLEAQMASEADFQRSSRESP